MGFGKPGKIFFLSLLLSLLGTNGFAPTFVRAHGDGDSAVEDAIDLSGDFHDLQRILLSRNQCQPLDRSVQDAGFGGAACDLAREPAPTPSQSTLPQDVRTSRQDDIAQFCGNPRVSHLATRFREGVTEARNLSGAAQAEFADQEAESLHDIIDDPYFSMASQAFFGSSDSGLLEGLRESQCREAANPVAPLDSLGSLARESDALRDAIRSACGDIRFRTAETPCSLTLDSCLTAGGYVSTSSTFMCMTIGTDVAAQERCLARAREFDESERVRVAEVNRRSREACEVARSARILQCETDRAAARAEEDRVFQDCSSRIQEQFRAQSESTRMQAAEESRRRSEQIYAECRAGDIAHRTRALCALNGQDGSSQQVFGEAYRRGGHCSVGAARASGAGSGSSLTAGSSSSSDEDLANQLRNQVSAMRSAYDHVFPEPKLETCLARLGGRNAQGVCDSLERARQRSEGQLSAIYSPERLGQANARLEQLKQNFRSFLSQQTSLAPADREHLLTRLNQVVIGAPSGSEALAGVIRGGATFNCGFSELPPGVARPAVRECTSSWILLPPDMFLKLTSGSDIDSGPVEAVLFHEMGHALAHAGTEAVFTRVNSCLARDVQVSGFPVGVQGTVRREALADWFGAQALGAQLRAAPERVRTEMFENRMGGEICGLLHRQEGSCVNRETTYFYPNEIINHPSLGEPCREELAHYDHPLTPDRLKILLSNGGMKRALGCSSESLRETRGCSL